MFKILDKKSFQRMLDEKWETLSNSPLCCAPVPHKAHAGAVIGKDCMTGDWYYNPYDNGAGHQNGTEAYYCGKK